METFITPRHDTATIIGAGIAGLLAARVLSQHFRRVNIIERNSEKELDSERTRTGVAQRHQLHRLLKRGERIIRHYFPGIEEDWRRMGAARFEIGSEEYYFSESGLMPLHRSGINLWSMTRTTFESSLLRKVRDIPNIRFYYGCHARSLLVKANKVIGVSYLNANRQAGGLLSDLVICAQGRSSKLIRWLSELGYDEPRTVTCPDLAAYASRLYRFDNSKFPWKSVIVDSDSRAGHIVPVEDGLSMVTLIGDKPDQPPKQEDAFLDYAKGLRHEHLYKMLREGTAIGPINIYRNMDSRCHFFNEMSRWPSGLLAVGDSLCHLNPIHGQGMSLSAITAEQLDRTFSRQRFRKPGWEKTFHDDVLREMKDAWYQATDSLLPMTPFPSRLRRFCDSFQVRYRARLYQHILRNLPHSPTLRRQHLEVRNLLRPTSSLLTAANSLRGVPRRIAKKIAKISGRRPHSTQALSELESSTPLDFREPRQN